MAARGRGAHVGGSRGELHLRARVDEGLHGAHEREGPRERRAGPIARIPPDGEECRRQAALLHPGHGDVAVGEPGRDVGLHVEQALRRVDVAVHDDRLLEHEEQS